MARDQGARAQLALAFETVYGTPPGSGYKRMPFVSHGLSADQPLLDSELLGYGRDPLAPVKDAVTVDGDIVVPMDAESMGYWLKGALGQATLAAAVAAAGAIVFSAQPAVSATLTINGTAFTAVASGATGNQFNIGANLAATLTNIVTVLNASVVAGVALATYGQTGGTTLTITYDTLGPAGNTFTLAASSAPASNGVASGATLTGGANSHTFNSGSYTLPSMAVEKQLPNVPYFAMHSGVMVDKLNWTMQRKGLLQMTVSLIGQGETPAAVTAAGTLGDLVLQRFGNFNGAIKRNGSPLANIISAEITYGNNLDRIETIRNDGKIDGLDPGMAMLSGSFVARFDSQTLLDQAINGTSCELEFSHVLSASCSFTLTVHAVYLPRPEIPIEGPQGIQATFAWQAAKAVSPARMCTAVLVNGLGAY